MYQITLTPDEAVSLRDALTSYISDLRSEVTHTENWEFRRQLKHSEACLKQVLEHLQGAGPATD